MGGRESRDDSHVSLQQRGREENRRARQMRRNSSLVTTTHRGDPWPGPGAQVVGPLPRTAVMMGAGSTPPGVDLDKVAASITEQNTMLSNTPVSQPRQFGRQLAGVLSGAAQNIKSRI